MSRFRILAARRERERYYLLAGMGGEEGRRKHKLFLLWSLLAASLVSSALAASLVWLNQL